MDAQPLFRRTPDDFPRDVLADPARGLAMARALWARRRFDSAMDLYDRLAQLHPGQAVAILAEAYDRFQEVTPRTRYGLYQSRFFDFPIRPGEAVLDIGSGHMPFPLATHLADISLTDGSIGRLGVPFKHVDGKPAYEVRVEDTGFADKQFDFVYCSHVLEHTDDPEAACRELARIGRRGYVETPTKGKDAFMGSARGSNHRWHVELVHGVLVFTEYDERDLEGFGVDLLMDMHVAPRTDREKAFSALIYLRADQCNTMFAWEGNIPCQVRRPPTAGLRVQVAPPPTPRPAESQAETVRLVQVHSFYPVYLEQFYAKRPELAQADYATQLRALVEDGFSGIHMLAPHLGPLGYEASLIVANNPYAQAAWAREHGLPPDLPPRAVATAQVNALRPQALYLSDPINYDSRFVRGLDHRPQCVLGWRAADIPAGWDPAEFDVLLSCLPGLRRKAVAMGAKDAEHFHPGFPAFLLKNLGEARADTDVVFAGQVNAVQYAKRNAKLRALSRAAKQGVFSCRLHLSGDLSVASPEMLAINAGPVYGLDMYRAMRRGRIAFDARGEIGLLDREGERDDLAGSQTANMRIFESTGLGVFLLTEHFANIGDLFVPGQEIETFSSHLEMIDKIRYYRDHPEKRLEIAERGQKRCLGEHSMDQCVRHFDVIVRRRLAAGSPAPSKDSTPHVVTSSAATLAGQLEKLSRLGAAPEILDPLLDEVLSRLGELVAGRHWDQAMLLGAAAKALRRPVRGLDLLRARTFQGQGVLSAARESLKEELRYFPDNAQAAELLRAVAAAEAQAAASVVFEPDLAAIMPVVQAYTMVAPAHLASLYKLARKACRADLPGDFAECGVAAGGTSAMLAYAIKRYSQRPRLLYCFDTFSGMPDPGEHDVHAGTSAQDTGWGAGTCAAPEDKLREVSRTLDAEEILRPVKGFFRDTLPGAAAGMQGLALLHMDGDWYESTRDILDNLYDQVVPGGLVQVDDYGFWEGCRKALTEFFQQRGLDIVLRPIPGGGGVWFRKPA